MPATRVALITHRVVKASLPVEDMLYNRRSRDNFIKPCDDTHFFHLRISRKVKMSETVEEKKTEMVNPQLENDEFI